MFQLMAHAFYKALLFMAAGSVISAMAGTQDIDRMSGFRRALPLTSLLLLVGALALAGFPGTAGFFSKDDILSSAADRGGFYWIFTVGGYAAALLTAFYAFRIVFRVVSGPPCPEARELEGGHLAHAEPFNPRTDEAEDTDVGFPGADHHIAERDMPMKSAMIVLGILSLFGGLIEVPGVDEGITNFLAGSFVDSSLYGAIHVSIGHAWEGLALGGLISIAGIALAYYCYVARPGVTLRLAARLPTLHRFLAGKWYFDELYDAVVYRPLIAAGGFANSVFERVVVQGIVAGTVGVVRSVGVLVRGAQSGFVRGYALLLVGGFAALGLYFLIVSH
jgi:NADH-quinone oxidoreductase subunit L